MHVPGVLFVACTAVQQIGCGLCPTVVIQCVAYALQGACIYVHVCLRELRLGVCLKGVSLILCIHAYGVHVHVLVHVYSGKGTSLTLLSVWLRA